MLWHGTKYCSCCTSRTGTQFNDCGGRSDSGGPEDALLEEFRQLNEKFAAGDVEEDDFEYRKAEIFAQLGLGEAPEPRESDSESDD